MNMSEAMKAITGAGNNSFSEPRESPLRHSKDEKGPRGKYNSAGEFERAEKRERAGRYW
jgi:hypothetical protein